MDVPLTAEAVRTGLPTKFIGQRIVYYPSLVSTMEAGKLEASRGAPDGTVVVAGEQVGGRGRLGRAWVSPPGNLAASIMLYPQVSYLPKLIMAASVAVRNTIKAMTGLTASIKWPNDVQINGRKICGILIDNSIKGNTVEYTVIGIGINVNIRMDDYPDLKDKATSLADETGKEIPLVPMLRRLLVEFEKCYTALPASLFQEWQTSLVTLGKYIRVRWGDNIEEGLAESVAENGSLWLRRDDGSMVNIVAGEATLREAK